MNAIQKKFGENVRHFRGLKQISQEALAELTQLHRTYISGIERGYRNPSLMNINKIARSLEVSLTELFRGVEE